MFDNFGIVDGLIILSIPIIIVIIKYIIYYRKKKIVLKHSNKIRTLKYINTRYEYKHIEKKLHKVAYKAKSKKQLDNITSDTIILDCIEKDIDGLRIDIESALDNIATYDKYLEEVRSLYDNVKFSYHKDLYIPREQFYTIEEKLIKKYTLKYNFDISCLIKIYYITPKETKKYVKKVIVPLDNLIDIYDKWMEINNYRQTKQYERAKMSNSLRYDILRRDGFRCQICGATQEDGVKLHVDHIIPVAKGGKTEYGNLRTLCEECNRGKSDKIE